MIYMKIKEVLEPYGDQLLEAVMVLGRVLNVDKSYIYTYIDRQLEPEELAAFKAYMERLESGYPIQYLFKSQEFMGLDFYVDQGVLIPRPDTEVLVEYLIDYSRESCPRILEIGFGSGAISLSLANYLPQAEIWATDISDQAYEIASINKARLEVENVKLLKADLFQGLQGEKFDIIVSNPPYIRSQVVDSLDRKVRDFEPRLALDGGQDGLDFYRRIIEEAEDYLRPSGLLIFEVGYDQGQQVEELLRRQGFKNIRRLKDLQTYDRVILGFR